MFNFGIKYIGPKKNHRSHVCDYICEHSTGIQCECSVRDRLEVKISFAQWSLRKFKSIEVPRDTRFLCFNTICNYPIVTRNNKIKKKFRINVCENLQELCCFSSIISILLWYILSNVRKIVSHCCYQKCVFYSGSRKGGTWEMSVSHSRLSKCLLV